MAAAVPDFSPTEAPRDALRRALEYLADVVPDVQLVRSRNLLRRVRGTTRLHLWFQSSTWSRRGAGVWCSMNATVHDKALGAWRAEHPELSRRKDDFLTTFGRLGPDIQLYGPLDRHRALADVPAFLVEEALPRLDWFETPARALADIPAQERRNSLLHLVEWAVSRGDRDAALEMLRRSFDEAPAMRERAEEQRRTGIPEGMPSGNAAELLGPAITRMELVALDEPLP
jgi:hypothetical protein